MIKKTALLLALALLFTLVGCSGGDKPVSEPEAPAQSGSEATGTDSVAPEYPDLDGYDCKIVQYEFSSGIGYTINEENPLGYRIGTSFEDELLERIGAIEDATGCGITIETTKSEATAVLAFIASETMEGELLYSGTSKYLMTIAKGGGFLAVDGFDVIDLHDTAKWGNANVIETNSYLSHVYGLCPISWPYKQPYVTDILAVNTGLLADHALTDPHEYLENKTWSWDNIEEILRDYHIKEGDYEIKALGAMRCDIIRLASYGNGAFMIKKDADGNYVSNIGDEAMLEAVTWSVDMIKRYDDSFAQKDIAPAYDIIATAFGNGQSMAALVPTQSIYNSIMYNVDGFAILPFPNGPRGTYGQWPGVLSGTEAFSLLLTADVPEYALEVVNLLSEPFDSLPDTDALKEYYLENVYYDGTDIDNLFKLYSSSVYSYWPMNADWAFWRPIASGINTQTPAELIQKNTAAYKEIIDEYVIPNQGVYDIAG